MYSTASEKTRVIWAAHSYNVAFADEIGHFQFCNGPRSRRRRSGWTAGNPITCPAGNTEGSGAKPKPTDGDDDFCFPASESVLSRCRAVPRPTTASTATPTHPVWPDGNTRLHPTPFQFTSAHTGNHFNKPYQPGRVRGGPAAIEPTCDRTTGNGCTLIPTTDSGQPAQFYPYFSTKNVEASMQCTWQFGNDIPGSTQLRPQRPVRHAAASTYLAFGGGGSTVTRFNNFRNIIAKPC